MAITVSISSIRGLLYIFEDYVNFKSDLLSLYKSNNQVYIQSFVCNSLKDSQNISDINIQKFYLGHKHSIDILNDSSVLNGFIMDIYYNDNTVSYMYEYLKNQKKDIKQAIRLIEYLGQLGFKEFKFSENYDFTNNEYKIKENFKENVFIQYFDNMETISGYLDGTIRYKTSKSNYKISLDREDDQRFQIGRSEICLNNLFFSINRLPKTLTKEDIFDYIIELSQQKRAESKAITDVVNLEKSILILQNSFDKVESLISEIETIPNKNDLIDMLNYMKEKINKMQIISRDSHESIQKTYGDKLIHILEKEKRKQKIPKK